MKNIYFRDGILIYYGNPAGYLSEGTVVLDSIFDKEEIIAFLSGKEKLAVEIRSGVYDRLSEGGGMDMTVEAAKGRRIRIYQLKQDSPFMMRFISLAEREKRGLKTAAEGVCACLRGRGGYLQSGRCLGEVWQKGAKGL